MLCWLKITRSFVKELLNFLLVLVTKRETNQEGMIALVISETSGMLA
jgi:hypothetical protein